MCRSAMCPGTLQDIVTSARSQPEQRKVGEKLNKIENRSQIEISKIVSKTSKKRKMRLQNAVFLSFSLIFLPQIIFNFH